MYVGAHQGEGILCLGKSARQGSGNGEDISHDRSPFFCFLMAPRREPGAVGKWNSHDCSHLYF